MNFHNYAVLSLPHLVAGTIGLLSGLVALSVLKGGGLHRRSGLVFTGAMLAVAVSGVVMASVKAQRFNLIGGLMIPALRGSAVLIVPVVGLLLAMFYWMVRVRRVSRYRDWDLTNP